MVTFMNYNFTKDKNSLDPFPTNLKTLSIAQAENAIYDEIFITNDVESEYTTEKPTEWDFYTLFWAQFKGNLNAGNIDVGRADIDAVRIKRRKLGEFEWMTIKEYPIVNIEDINFVGEDFFAENGVEYEYAWVSVLNGVEGNYVIESVESKFKGVFVCDVDSLIKFYAGVQYGSNQQVQQVGSFTPLGKKYPVYVSNGAVNYQTGTLSATLVGDYEQTHQFDRNKITEQKNNVLKFLTNKKPKIIKDENGNIWLVVILGNPEVSFDGSWGNGIGNVSFQWSEVGDANSEKDLRDCGLLPIIE